MKPYHTFEEMLGNLAGEETGKDFLFCARTGRSVNYLSFWQQIRVTAKILKQYGLKEKARILLLMDNSIEFAVNYFAIICAGAVAVPVNTHLKWKEIQFILEDSGAIGMIADEKYLELLPEDWPSQEESRISQEEGRVSQEESRASQEESRASQEESRALQEEKGFSWKDLQKGVVFLKTGGRPQEKEAAAGTADDIPDGTVMILYTSGTTGHPKGVMLSCENLLSKAEDIKEAHQLTREDCVLCVLPWFHINGLVITLITPLYTGHRIVIGGKFSVTNFWKDLETYQATWFSGVPTMYSHMLARGIPESGRHSSLRFARSASSPLPAAVLEEFEANCHVPIIESYGITEGCAQITTNPLPPAEQKVGSVGLPYGNRIRITGIDGAELPAGKKGEVWIQGSNITCGYYHRTEENKKSFTENWFHSGDLGCLDADGYLYLEGRIKELINRAGEKFSPVEVDEVLYQLPEVELAATAGVYDAVYGEKTASFLKLKEGCRLTKQQVTEWCRNRIASYKVPDKVYFVEDIPKGGNGKIQRLKLVDIYNNMSEQDKENKA
ncbi:MAG: AMP-binding protein [Lachnospiraceae bacterium]|nr:AMP-binding protein [Lachnospiraceae bacterium]